MSPKSVREGNITQSYASMRWRSWVQSLQQVKEEAGILLWKTRQSQLWLANAWN